MRKGIGTLTWVTQYVKRTENGQGLTTVHSGWLDQGRPPTGEARAGLSLPLPATHRGIPSPKRMPSGRGGRDRFTAESYTVLGKEGRQEEGGLGPDEVSWCWGNGRVWGGGYCGEPGLAELRKEARPWGVAGQEPEGGLSGLRQTSGTWGLAKVWK